ncbi:MAG: hypothetical protein IPK78_17595 [Rhodospirillales bacterium]|nr:hypothetical protein [Rhodospirillales bacterium]
MSNDGDPRRVRELRETAARKYLPEKVDLLLVAEAPPAEEDRYFYFEHVPSNDWLFLGVAEMLLGEKPSRTNKANMLAELKNRGTFLIDVKPYPADGSDLAMYVPDLVRRCAALKPRRIILIKATVFDAAYPPLVAAGLPVVNKRVYFPSTGRQSEFKEQFAEALMEIPKNERKGDIHEM